MKEGHSDIVLLMVALSCKMHAPNLWGLRKPRYGTDIKNICGTFSSEVDYNNLLGVT